MLLSRGKLEEAAELLKPLESMYFEVCSLSLIC